MTKSRTRSVVEVLIGLLVGAAVIQACTPLAPPTLVYTTSDIRMFDALTAAKDELLKKGVILAQKIEINFEGDGISVEFATNANINRLCDNTNPQLNGCTNYADMSYRATDIWIRNSFEDEHLTALVLHEMIHALFPGIKHLEPTKHGLFLLKSEGILELTPDDMEHLKQYTAVQA